jgi:hypothetical protein
MSVGVLDGEFAQDIHIGFYAVMAQVIPVLMLTLVIELSNMGSQLADVQERVSRLPPGDERERLEEIVRGTSRMGRINFVSGALFALLGEVGALYAVATDTSTAILFSMCFDGAIVTLWLIMMVYLQRFPS